MNKQEATKELYQRKIQAENRYLPNEWSKGHQNGLCEGLQDSIKIVEQIDVEQKPMLNKAEVNWLEKLREVKHNTDEMIVAIARQNADCDFVFKSDGVSYKLPFERYKGKESYGSVRHRLLYAVIYGYETKPLYTVEIPNPNGSSKVYLGKNEYGKVELFTWVITQPEEFADDWKKEKNAQLTEEEIKEDFAWAWNEELQRKVEE